MNGFWVVLGGASGGRLWGASGKSLRGLWGFCQVSERLLGRFWGHLGASGWHLGLLGCSGKHFGGFWGASGEPLGVSGGSLGCLWESLGASGGIQGCLWRASGGSLEASGKGLRSMINTIDFIK